MKKATRMHFLSKGLYAILAFVLMAAVGYGQNVVVTGSGSFSGSGVINVAGNINTSTASSGVSIPGTVNLDGTSSTQQLGVSGSNALTFATLNATGSIAKQSDVNVTVTDALTVNITGSLNWDIQATTLTLGGTSALTTGSLDVSDGSSTVVYDQTGTSQTILGLTYAGNLTLSNTSTKDFASAASVAGTFSHTGGALTVNQDFTVSSTTPSFATIADVSAGKTLTLSGTGAKSITTVTSTNATGAITNSGASGLMTIGTLSDNNGTITTGAGGATFTLGATNHGTITGGAGAVTFSSTLAQAGGTITAGAGDITFSGTVTRTGGSMASSALANVLNFASDVSGSGGTIDLTSTGAAEFGGAVASTSGLNFATGTTVTYDGSTASQAIADVDYGNLVLTTNTKSWTLGAARTINNNLDVQASAATTIGGSFDLNVDGNVTLAADVTKSANAVVFANASSAVSGTGYEIIGSVTRTHTFAASTAYTFNNGDMTLTPSTVGTLSSFTITSQPSTNPTGYVNGNSVNRTYTESYSGSGFTAALQLSYLSGEYSGSLSSKLKIFHGGISSGNKLTGTYTRSTGSGFAYVSLPGITDGTLASGQELGLDDRFNIFTSIAAAAWNAGTTWDEGSVPTSTDDVVIAASYPVSIPDAYSASAYSATINATSSLTVGTGTGGSLAVGAGGLTNNSTAPGLSVAANGAVTITGGDLTNAGSVSNSGTITVQ